MVTMTLLLGIVNAFAFFVSRIIAYAVSQAMSSKDEEGDINPTLFLFVSELSRNFLTLLGSIVVCWYSRQREYRADIGSARLSVTKDKMSSALERLGRVFEVPAQPQPALAAMKISSPQGGWLALFRTHPPISDRLARLAQTPL